MWHTSKYTALRKHPDSFSSVQSLSHVQLFATPWINRSTPGLPVHHQLPEFTETHVHRVSNAIQPSHPLLSPSPPAPNPSQHQSLFQWVNSSHEVAKVLEFQLYHHSFQRTLRQLTWAWMLLTPWLSGPVFLLPLTLLVTLALNILSPLLPPGLATYCAVHLKLLSAVPLWL